MGNPRLDPNAAPVLAALAYRTITNPCGLCGDRTEPHGFDPVLAGTVTLVCDRCCQREAPQWWQAIETGRLALAADEKLRDDLRHMEYCEVMDRLRNSGCDELPWLDHDDC
jgi:hypothetical protein